MCDKIKLFIAACFCCFINMQIKNLHPCLKSFQTRPCFQLVFHWVSKPIHLTRMRCSGWVRAAWIINEFENKISHCPVIIQIYAPIIGLPRVTKIDIRSPCNLIHFQEESRETRQKYYRNNNNGLQTYANLCAEVCDRAITLKIQWKDLAPLTVSDIWLNLKFDHTRFVTPAYTWSQNFRK